MSNATPKKLYLKGARLHYTGTLFEAKAAKGSTTAKFGCCAIIEPSTKAFFGDMNPDSPAGQAAGLKWGDVKEQFSAAIVDAAARQWGPKALEVIGQLKAANKLPLHDGAEKGGAIGFAGNLYTNGSSNTRPIVRNRNGAQLEARDGVIYNGAYGDVVLDIWPQANQFGQRVNAKLLAVVFSHDGERLSGGATTTDSDFATIPQEAQAKAAVNGGGAANLF